MFLLSQKRKKKKKKGITCPIIPGIMPIHTYAGWKRMTTLSKTNIPPKMEQELELIKDDDQACKDYGINYCIEMIKKMMEFGIKGSLTKKKNKKIKK